MTSTLHAADGRVFSVETDLIEVTMRSRPDEHWRHVDPSGHVHQWYADGAPSVTYSPTIQFTLPTLELVVDVEGTDEYPDVTHLECHICRATVRPGHRSDDTRQYIQGLRSCYIDGRSVSREEFEREASAALNQLPG